MAFMPASLVTGLVTGLMTTIVDAVNVSVTVGLADNPGAGMMMPVSAGGMGAIPVTTLVSTVYPGPDPFASLGPPMPTLPATIVVAVTVVAMTLVVARRMGAVNSVMTHTVTMTRSSSQAGSRTNDPTNRGTVAPAEMVTDGRADHRAKQGTGHALNIALPGLGLAKAKHGRPGHGSRGHDAGSAGLKKSQRKMSHGSFLFSLGLPVQRLLRGVVAQVAPRFVTVCN